jgi:hypothetical protein
MLTKEIKKGTRVLLRNGWEAETLESARKTTVLCEVYGFCTECGSVYGHDIVAVIDVDGHRIPVTEWTPGQMKCKAMVQNFCW